MEANMTAQSTPASIRQGKRMRRSSLLGLVILVGLVGFGVWPSPVTGQASPDGSYEVAGTSQDGSTYSGTAKIAKQGDVFLISWTINGETHGGIGIVEGNTLSIGWGTSGRERLGVIAYNIESDRLVGRWALIESNGDTEVGHETLTRSP
jgi:hypothetical protein